MCAFGVGSYQNATRENGFRLLRVPREGSQALRATKMACAHRCARGRLCWWWLPLRTPVMSKVLRNWGGGRTHVCVRVHMRARVRVCVCPWVRVRVRLLAWTRPLWVCVHALIRVNVIIIWVYKKVRCPALTQSRATSRAHALWLWKKTEKSVKWRRVRKKIGPKKVFVGTEKKPPEKEKPPLLLSNSGGARF